MASVTERAVAAKAIWERLNGSQRLLVITSAAVVVAAIAGLSYLWGHEQTSALYTGLSPEDASAIVARLKEMKVPFALSASGTTVEVPSARLDELRLTLASNGMPTSGSLGFEIFDRNQLGMTSFTEDVNLRRALEGELARTVKSMEEIDQARVHLVLKRRGGFGLDKDTSKASVVINEAPGRRLEARNVRAIQELVAYAVEGLEPDAVVVVNNAGELLSVRPNDPSIRAESGNLQERQRIERAIESNVLSLLEPLYGTGEVNARVAAEVDFSVVDERAELVLPEQRAVISEHLSQETGVGNRAVGVPGVRSNVDPGTNSTDRTAAPGSTDPNATSAQPTEPRRSSETRNFEVSKTVRHTTSPEWVVRRLSVAVLINDPPVASGASDRSAGATKVASLVEAAVGLDSKRGDRVQVEFLPFATPVVAAPTRLETVRQLTTGWSRPLLGLMIALVAYFMFVRPLKQQTLKALKATTVHALPPAPASVVKAARVANKTPARGLSAGVSAAERVVAAQEDQDDEGEQPATTVLPEGLRQAVTQVAAADPAATARFIKGWLGGKA